MRRSLVTNFLILTVTLGLVVGAFASFQRKRSSFERIDFTFTRHNGIVVVKLVDPGSNAEAAGLRPESCVFSPDGTKIAFVRQMAVKSESHNQIFVVARNSTT